MTGSYTLSQDSNALTEFHLGGTADSIYVDVARSGNGLLALAQTRNQRAVASALAALGSGNGAYAALTLSPSDDVVRHGFEQLTGEIHASVMTSMVKDAQAAQYAVFDRLASVDGPGIGAWAQVLYRTGTDGNGSGGDRAVGRTRSDMGGAMGGIDSGIGDWGRIGIAAGYTRTKLYLESRGSTARSESAHLLGYASGRWGPVTVKAMIGYAWSDIDTHRSISLAGFGNELTANYDGSVLHGRLDAGYSLSFGGGFIEPFAAVEGYRVKRDGFAEPGAGAALTSGDRIEKFWMSTLGARAETPITGGLKAQGSLGWRHAFDNIDPSSLMRFSDGTVPFRVIGTPLAKNAVSAAIGLTWKASERVRMSGGYSGVIGNATDESRFQVALGVGF